MLNKYNIRHARGDDLRVTYQNLRNKTVQQGGNIFRLLGFFDGATLIILTNGFAKKTQKTPMDEIRLAEARKRDYFEQQGENDE